MGKQVGARAIVLGGSMGGLLTARVLADSFAEVVVVDRDQLIGVREPRRGTPQVAHAHALQPAGAQALEELFPGVGDEMRAAGLAMLDMAQMHWHVGPYRLASIESGLTVANVRRPVLEAIVRDKVAALPGVRLLEGHDIVGLTTTADRTRVTGARVAAHGADGAGEGAEQVIDADLVIDATGRGSRTPAWLEELGYARPDEERIKIGLSYTTCEYRMERHPFADEQSAAALAVPFSPRGAYFGRCEGDRYVLSLVGMLGDGPEKGYDAFVEYTRSLPFPDLYDAIKDRTPLAQPVTFRFPASQRRHYEKLSAFPAGLLVTGDAVCSFNPIFGQGMSVAAMEARVLGDLLTARGVPDARTWFRRIRGVVDAAWNISAGGDLTWPQVEAPRPLPVRMGNAFMAKVQAAALVDGEVTGLFMRVCGLVDPITILLRPRNLRRILRSAKKAEAMVAADMAAAAAAEASQQEQERVPAGV